MPTEHRTTGVLRLTTCGAVDDGKSTLLGRLLLDAGAVFEDHLAALYQASATLRPAFEGPDPSLLFDGLAAEREQGITIDVAYRYFSTNRRSFIIADAPGHETHTRNMATAASNADVAVIVVDAARGVSPQTLRHIRIAGLVGVRHAIVAVNKMDAVGFVQERFEELRDALAAACADAGLSVFAEIPVAARSGDNVVTGSARLGWYRGPTLLAALEAVDVDSAARAAAFRFPVQLVQKPHPQLGGRGYAGTIASGRVRRGDTVAIAHFSGTVVVDRIFTAQGPREDAEAGEAVTLTLLGDHDVARGDLLVGVLAPPIVASTLDANLIVLDEGGVSLGRRYELRCAARAAGATIRDVALVESFGEDAAPFDTGPLPLNTIARCTLELSRPIPIDHFADHRHTGGFLLVDRVSGATVAAGMTVTAHDTNVRAHRGAVTAQARRALMGHGAAALWFTGLSGSGKSTIADLVERKLHAAGVHSYALDGDNLRGGLNRDLGFSAGDRIENIRRAGEVARLLVDAGLIVTCAFISPYQADRALVRDLLGRERFLELHVDAPLQACIDRDPKGLYKRALAGEIAEFSGVSAPYEAPTAPDLRLATMEADAEALAQQVIGLLRARGLIA